MRSRQRSPQPRVRPILERLEPRSLLTVDFHLAFPIAAPKAFATVDNSAVDSAGNIFVCGQIQGTTEFGGTGPSSKVTPTGKADAFVAKYSPAGKLIWVIDGKEAPTKIGEATGVAVDSAGNAYVVGVFNTKITFGGLSLNSTAPASFAVKFDPAGNLVKAIILDSDTSISAFSVAVDANGEAYVAGTFEGKAFGGTLTAAGGNTNRDAFVAKFKPNGTFDWAVRMGGTLDDFASRIAVDGAGTAYVAGEFQGTAQFGAKSLISVGDYDEFVTKLNAAGTVLWARGVGGTSLDESGGLAINASGNLFLGGDLIGTVTIAPGLILQGASRYAFVAAFTGQGDPIWAHALSATSSVGEGVAVDSLGNVYASGAFRGTADFDPGPGTYSVTGADFQAFLWEFDGAGHFEAVRTALATGVSFGDVAPGPKGSVLFVGSYNGSVQVGTFALPDIASTGFSGSFISVLTPPVTNDFDNDGKADLAVFRPTTDQWLLAPSGGGGGKIIPFGGPGDVPVPGNYLGTGKSELAVYRPSTSTWYSLAFGAIQFGAPGDQPVPADYDGDGQTDLAVFRPSTGQWFVRRSTTGPLFQPFGAPGMIPVPADYDGDGKADIAAFDPKTATWFVLGSTSGPFAFQFGAPGLDLPIPADYTGSGRASFAVYRPGTALWLINGLGAFNFGAPNGDIPVPADYLGNGHAQLAVYRAATAQWFILGAGAIGFGQPNLDIPLQLPLVYRSGFFGRTQTKAATAAPQASISAASFGPIVPIAQIPATTFGASWPDKIPQAGRKAIRTILD